MNFQHAHDNDSHDNDSHDIDSHDHGAHNATDVHPRRLVTAEAVKEFMFAGNATVTLKSEKTGNRFTYKVKSKNKGAVYFVSLMTGPDNESSFGYIGFIKGGEFVHHRAKSQIAADAPSVRGFKWFHAHIETNDMPLALEVWHEGRCGACNRKLTVPESIERGIGPECFKRAA
jgi:hypothetical protein